MRKILCSILAASLILSLVGCGQENDNVKNNSNDADEIVEEELYVYNEAFSADNGDGTYSNPLIYADVPDMDIIKVGDVFYMASTTMHMCPGVPIMRSYDLVNWETINYVYNILSEEDNFALKNGRSDYQWGSWAPSLRYDEASGWFFLTFSSQSTGKSYFYMTDDIEKGKWYKTTAEVKCYDAGLYFDEESGKKYIFYSKDTGIDAIHDMCYREMYVDYEEHTVSLGDEVTLFHCTNYENPQQGLWGEGVHVYRRNGYYYIFCIQGVAWQRQEICWRAESLDARGRWDEGGEWECKKVFNGDIEDEDGNKPYASTGVAQGGIVELSDEGGYCYLFQDTGAVGRIPCLAPFVWGTEGEDKDWPIMGTKVGGDDAFRQNYMQLTYDKPIDDYDVKALIHDDDFDNYEENYRPYDTEWDGSKGNGEYDYNGSQLALQWQWNHNPDNRYWSLTERKGYLRLTTGYISQNIRNAKNTVTVRTIGPQSAAETAIEFENLKEGDVAGLTIFQNQYGYVGVTVFRGERYIVMHKADAKDDSNGRDCAMVKIEEGVDRIYLRIDADFNNRVDKAYFYYRFNENNDWTLIGEELQMVYDLPDFMGYRFGLFTFATEETGGYADFDYVKFDDELVK